MRHESGLEKNPARYSRGKMVRDRNEHVIRTIRRISCAHQCEKH